MGEGTEGIAPSEKNWFGPCEAHHVGISPQEDRGGTKGEVGENTGCEDEIGCLEANGLERSCSL